MKSIYKFSTLILTIVVLNTMNTEGLQDYHTYVAADMTFNAQVNPPITHQQTKAQVELFRQALDKLGATSPEEVISIWASAEEMRNGVFHYAVACDELKSKIVNEWGEPKDNFWIIGGSSPWLERYEIVYNKKLNDSEYEVKLKFFWISSIGPSEPTETTLLIGRNKDKWCVKEAK